MEKLRTQKIFVDGFWVGEWTLKNWKFYKEAYTWKRQNGETKFEASTWQLRSPFPNQYGFVVQSLKSSVFISYLSKFILCVWTHKQNVYSEGFYKVR